MEHRSEPIERATALLSTVLHCRKQADALRTCRHGGGGDSSCDRQEAAFVTCSQEHIGLVVGHLAKISESHCPSEIEALRRCRLNRPGDDCEYEDMEAMRCASLRVLAAAAAPKQS